MLKEEDLRAGQEVCERRGRSEGDNVDEYAEKYNEDRQERSSTVAEVRQFYLMLMCAGYFTTFPKHAARMSEAACKT